MTAPPPRSRPGDPGLWERFRAIRPKIRAERLELSAPLGPGHRADRVTLNEQTARRERRPGSDGSLDVIVDSGPLGALLLLLEWDDRDEVPVFRPVDRGEPDFPEGAIVARFGGPPGGSLPAKQILDLARFALP